jgi:hypothetical protein
MGEQGREEDKEKIGKSMGWRRGRGGGREREMERVMEMQRKKGTLQS